MVEKERKKDLGKVVTGGGEGTEAEGTEKANHSAAGPQPNRCGGIKIFARGKESTG